jgi:nucleoside-diphosphate-sugar epimerase
MLEAARSERPVALLHPRASASQFGIPQRNPVDETHPDAPVTVYCAHKLFAEQYLELYCRLGWAHGCAFRMSNVYGPGPRSSSADRGVLNQMIHKALRGEALTVFGSGNQLRDYIYVDDVTSAFGMAAMSPDARRRAGTSCVLGATGTSLREAFHAGRGRRGRKLGTRGWR